MNLVSDSVLVVSAASLTLGLIHLRMCFKRRQPADVLFVVAAFSLAVFAWIERGMMFASSPGEYGTLVRWLHVPAAITLISIAWFIYLYLRSGRLWLLWTFTAARLVVLLINFLTETNLNFREITAMVQTTVLGETIWTPVAVLNPFTFLGQASLLLFTVFCVDAVIPVWKKRAPWRALRIGGAVTVFSACSLLFTATVLWGQLRIPFVVSLFFLVVIFAMGYELSRDVHKTAELAEDLKEREAALIESLDHLNLTAGAANVGVWTYDLETKKMRASEKWREIFEFDASIPVSIEEYFQKVHPGDREMIEHTFKAATQNGDHYETEYRILLANGNIRWITSRGRVDIVDGVPTLLRAASVDITKRKLAEQSAHDLTHKLIYAQERERARLARELHDDLSQSLAMLSMQVDVLGQDPVEPETIRAKTRQIMGEIHRLSTDVHRISHELHPAKLGQLGLEAAMRGFCREIAEARSLKVDFEAGDVPRSMSNDLELCLYRVAQESLQNIAKHSGASRAAVRLDRHNQHITLTITDDGHGFDPDAVRTRESLGLVSMQERVLSVEGTLTVTSHPDTGTEIAAVIPLREPSQTVI